MPALAVALTSDKSTENCALYIEVLAKIGSVPALKTLVACSLENTDKEVRVTALEALVTLRCPEIVDMYVAALRPKDKDADAARINRAGLALGYLKDPSAVGPLIDALNTSHKVVLSQGNPGQTSATFGSGPGNTGGGGLSVGAKTSIVRVHTHNDEVLTALVNITGQNYSFDVDAWHHWHAAQKKSQAFDARRDEPAAGK